MLYSPQEAKTMKSKTFFVFLFSVLLVGCTQTASTMTPASVSEMAQNLTYAKDPRTNLCFAAVASRHVTDVQQNGFTITYVPCTPEVEAQIQKQK